MKRRLGHAVFLLATSAATADVMNLNEFMPTRLEDASTIERRTLDLQWATSFHEDHPDDEIIHRPVVRYGATDQLQLDLQGTIVSGGEETHNGSVDVGGLYQFNESTTLTPIIAFNPSFTLPSGRHNDGEDFEYKFIISGDVKGTSEIPFVQFHFNFKHAYNDEPGPDERTNRFMYVIGASKRLATDRALVMDFVMEEKLQKFESSNVFELGLHQQVGKQFQLGVGLFAGLGEDSPSWGSNLGLELQF